MLIRSFRCAAVAALFSICGVALAQEPAGGGETPPPAAGQDAGSRMRAALDAVAELTGVKGEERRERLLACATTFDGIADAFANDLDVVARAAWEAGECRRRAGELESANASYERCLATGSKRYLERASFEHGSMLRRMKRYDDAIAAYRQTVEVRPDSARAHDARVWIGRCLEAKGDVDAALAAFGEAEQMATTPARTIDAIDRLARLLVRSGRLDEAAAAIGRADAAGQPIVEAGGKAAERMQRRLESMSSRRALQRARDAKNDAAGDAVRLEADRAGRGAGG